MDSILADSFWYPQAEAYRGTYPSVPDFTKMFKLYTDASDIGLRAVLMQKNDQGKDRVICYKAKTLLLAEKNYLTTEKECLAVMWTMQKFKHFLREG